LLLLRPFTPTDRSWLVDRLGYLYDIIEPPTFDDATLSSYAGDADAALGAAISPRTLNAASRLKLLQTPGSGVEKLDLAALDARGIVVCNSSSHAPHVAEHGMALLLTLMRKVALHDRLLRQGVWYRPTGDQEDALFQSDSLRGATVGLVGYGAINQAVAKLMSGFDVKLRVHARMSRTGIEMATLAELMTSARAVFVALPLTPSTRGLIGARELALGDPYLVNLGRAEVIDHAALIDALANHRIRGAAIDVPYGETDTMAGLEEFAHYDNTVVSPHRAGTLRGPAPHLAGVVENLIAFAQGLPPKNVVDTKAGY
jgi:phosphoglycerate dehydrogenase-like enzyme